MAAHAYGIVDGNLTRVEKRAPSEIKPLIYISSVKAKAAAEQEAMRTGVVYRVVDMDVFLNGGVCCTLVITGSPIYYTLDTSS